MAERDGVTAGHRVRHQRGGGLHVLPGAQEHEDRAHRGDAPGAQVPPPLPLPGRPRVRLHARAHPGLDPLRHPGVRERARVAGPSARQGRHRLRPPRQLPAGHRRPRSRGGAVPPYTPLTDNVPPRRSEPNAWWRATSLSGWILVAWRTESTLDPAASMPTASMADWHRAPPVASATASVTSSTAEKSRVSTPWRSAKARRSGTWSMPSTRPAPQRLELRTQDGVAERARRGRSGLGRPVDGGGNLRGRSTGGSLR